MGKLIFLWPLVSLQHLPQWECQEPSDLSDCDDTDEAVNTKLLSLSNPLSGEGEVVGVATALGSFAATHNPCLTVVCGVGANGQRQHLQCILPMGTHLPDRI